MTGGDLLSFADALAEVRRSARGVRPAGSGEVPLWEAHGRVLAKGIVADRDQPPFDRATRDGFAVSLARNAEARTNVGDADSGAEPKRWRVLGEVFAGASWSGAALREGEAVEIMTGAPVPAGADAVVMVEHVEERAVPQDPGTAHREVTLGAGRTVAPEANVVRRGTEARAGEPALGAGVLLGPAEIALAAALGAATVQVRIRPRVAILSTGDELVELGDPETPVLAPQQIRNSNSYALAALVHEAGGRPWRLPLARDTRASIRAAVEQARAGADMLLLTGGVSAGKKDLVEEVLLELGATFRFIGVRMQPGKPVVFGAIAREFLAEASEAAGGHAGPGSAIPCFGLPGNPVSTEVTFRTLVAPLLRALCGEAEATPRFAAGQLAEKVTTDGSLTRFLPARVESLTTDGTPGAEVRLVAWKGSGDLASNARANCYAVLTAGREVFAEGEWIPVLLR